MAGFDFPALMQRLNAEEKAPRTKEQTLELLRTSGEKWAGWIHFPMISWRSRLPCRRGGGLPPKSRFEMILSVKEHEMRHRGQLMLIERIIGIVPHLTRDMHARIAAAAAKK